MKLTELAAKQAAENPKFKDMSSDDIINELHSRTSQQLKETREALKKAKPTGPSTNQTFSLQLTPEGELKASKNVIFNGEQYNNAETLLKSEGLAKIANLVRPLMGVTRAIVRAGKVSQGNALHHLDKDGKRTNQVMKQGDDVLYNADPLSQLKMLFYVLESNPETKKALTLIGEALKDFTSDKMKEMAVTESILKSTKPVKAGFRVLKDPASSLKESCDADVQDHGPEPNEAKAPTQPAGPRA